LAAACALSIGAALLAIVAVQYSSGAHAGGAARAVEASAASPPRDLAWLHPVRPPRGWRVARLPSSSAALAYPSGWHTIATDSGTVSVALTDRSDTIVSYLNATPRQGVETLANWSSFRPHHVAAEGARDVRVLARAEHLPFRSGQGSCVIDSYSTSKTRYIEIACLVQGARAATVIVGAAQPGAWSSQGPLLERAIASFTP
jgi:hypothetical protein